MTPTTLFDKIWSAHEIASGLIFIDLHLVHEVTSPQAFEGLRLAGREVRRPDRTLATADHNVPTDGTPISAKIHDLGEGDAVTFDADLSHHFENPTDKEAVLLAVVSAGLRRS